MYYIILPAGSKVVFLNQVHHYFFRECMNVGIFFLDIYRKNLKTI